MWQKLDWKDGTEHTIMAKLFLPVKFSIFYVNMTYACMNFGACVYKTVQNKSGYT